MCDLDESFEDLEITITEDEIKILGWDDKEWFIESITFISSIILLIYLYFF
ncbi:MULTISPECIES: hypothetical protein [Aliivibrio]|jgi:hypothetical protein|uniref:hypothetical protein n=1 Tax=Aliivibrio TaxID=511678 RepID=UPI0015E2FCFE|nr:hypothetical protein [Aliivibrio sifiae]